ncbi:MAG TPA: hypothetical protein VEZ51_02610, partial [Gemmatimonadaceae bacterium]|nr:hypothetical protein [Gemmatimonadaceae bacterium]
MKRLARTLFAVLFAASFPHQAAGQRSPPTLIVLITIDQFRADYIDRFDRQLHGGLARISRGGAWFT